MCTNFNCYSYLLCAHAFTVTQKTLFFLVLVDEYVLRSFLVLFRFNRLLKCQPINCYPLSCDLRMSFYLHPVERLCRSAKVLSPMCTNFNCYASLLCAQASTVTQITFFFLVYVDKYILQLYWRDRNVYQWSVFPFSLTYVCNSVYTTFFIKLHPHTTFYQKEWPSIKQAL